MSTGEKLTDTIVAIATGLGAAGVGIVRLSGPDARAVGVRLVPSLGSAEPRKLVFGRIFSADGTEELDEGLAVFMAGPRTFTGEDVVEIHAHGGRLNLRLVVNACLVAGARPALPGEFTRRAYVNGRIDLTRAEAIADIVDARSRTALRVAQSQRRGALADKVFAFRQTILKAKAHLEVNIDFVHEDVPIFEREGIGRELTEVRDGMDALLHSYARGRVMRDGLRVALAGVPNAGKSSLFNSLLRDGRAIVTDVAGTTRDYLEERLDVGDIPVVLVDTAGLRDSEDVVEKVGIDRSRFQIAAADIVIAVHDGSKAPATDDAEIRAAVPDAQRIDVVNKADQEVQPGWAVSLPGALPVSARTSLGLDALEAELADRAEALAGTFAPGEVITRQRHAAALTRSIARLEEVQATIEAGMPVEITAGEVQLALDELASIVGETTNEDVLDHIFGEFCIGK